jgi:dienelactone hydrolase
MKHRLSSDKIWVKGRSLPTGRKPRRIRWLLPILAAVLGSSLGWLSLSADPKITGLRNIGYYRVVKALGGPRVHSDQPPGAITGTVRDAQGAAVANALVLVSSPMGDTYAATSGADGTYHIPYVPPGHYVPVAGKRGYQDALNQTCAAGLCYKPSVPARPDIDTMGVDLSLDQTSPLEIMVNESLVLSPTVEVETSAPLPGKALRTHFSFERAGLWMSDCWLYEPAQGQGPFATLLLVLPGPVLNWEIIPVPFAAQGFSVLACYPLRGMDIDGDAVDLLTALEYLRQSRLPSHGDPEHLGLVGASFTSLHAYRLLELTDRVDVALVLGGLADAFAFRHDVEMGTAQTRPPFDQVLMALGLPNTSPELYFKFSAIYHLEGMPPLCILHGVDDELVPFNQSVMLDRELTRRTMPHEFYSYEGLSHYFSTNADNATTQQMFRDSLECLRRSLGDEQ